MGHDSREDLFAAESCHPNLVLDYWGAESNELESNISDLEMID